MQVSESLSNAGGTLPKNSGAHVERARHIVQVALDRKAQDVVTLDVREMVSFADTFVIATGTSDRHVRSIVDGIDAALAEQGEQPLGIEGYEEGRWVLVDCNDLIVHVFLREVREHYDLERLWSDAPRLEIATSTEQPVKA